MEKKIINIIVLCLSFTIGSSVFGQVSRNLSLAGLASTGTMYGRAVNFADEGPIADVWSWTYQGREYALACLPNNHIIKGWNEIIIFRTVI